MSYIVSYMKVMRNAFLNKLGGRVPIKVYHFVTNKCNLSCPFCLAKEFARSKEMTTEQVKAVMGDFKKKGVVLWEFCGGEPMLRKDIDELVDYSKKLGFVTTVVTNGTFIRKKFDTVKKFDEILISLDGNERFHDSIRGKGVYKEVIAAIEILNKAGIKPRINAVITKSNYGQIDFLAGLTKKYDVLVTFTWLVPKTKEGKMYMPPEDKLLEVVKKIRKLKRSNSKIVAPDEYLKRIEDYVLGKRKHFQPRCIAGKSFVVLSPFGEVTHCLERFKVKELITKPNINKQLKSLPKPRCDCTYRCYFMDNINYSLSARRLFKLVFNTLSGKGPYQ